MTLSNSSKSGRVYDLAIIGGGIAGTAVARDAALRGLSAVLLERDFIGCGTSSKSSKLIHGGIRYLDIAWSALIKGRFREFWKNFQFVFSSLRESRILERIAPRLVTPISLLIPIYKEQRKGTLAVFFGTIVYSLLGLLMGNRKMPHLLFSKKAVLKQIPSLKAEGLAGGVVIWDHTTDDLELVKKTGDSARRHGAEILEHCRVLTYAWDAPKKIYRLELERTGGRETVFAKKAVNASGPWIDRVRKSAQEMETDLVYPVAGCHIMVPKFCDRSVILEAADGRIFFVIDRGDKARVGTTERVETDPDAVKATDGEIDYLLGELKRYFPGETWNRSKVLGHDAGVRPLARPADRNLSPHQVSREHELRLGPTGVLHMVGVKLTDHRRAAREALDMLFPGTRCRTGYTPLESGG